LIFLLDLHHIVCQLSAFDLVEPAWVLPHSKAEPI